MGNIKVNINPQALDESAFVESVKRAENRDRSEIERIQKRMLNSFKTKRSIATMVDIGLEKHKLTKKT